MEIGVDCIKIEGRTKSHYYAARTAQLYRRAIDDAAEGKEFDMSLMDSLENLASRGYTEGFLRRHVHDEYQNYENGSSRSDKQQFVGEVLSASDNSLEIDVKNHFEVGDKVELMLPEGNSRFNLPAMQDKYKAEIEVAKGSGQIVHIPIPEEYNSDTDFSKALLLRDLM
jgi:putative protease